MLAWTVGSVSTSNLHTFLAVHARWSNGLSTWPGRFAGHQFSCSVSGYAG